MKTIPRSLLLALSLLLLSTPTEAQGKIVFTQGVNGRELWVLDTSTSTGPQFLLARPSYIVSPRWSPDGTRIAFQEGTNLWIVDANGSNLHAVPGAVVADSGLTWSPNGNGFAYAAVRPCAEYLRKVDDDGNNNLTFYDPGFGAGPALFPDASPVHLASMRVAYMRYRCGGEFTTDPYGIEITEMNGLNLQAIPLSPGVYRQQQPRWSGDGQKLLSVVRFLGSNDSALEIVDLANLSAPRPQHVRIRSQGFFGGIDFGCRSSEIYFAIGETADGAARNVWRMDASTNSIQRLTNFVSGNVRDLDFIPSHLRLQQANALETYSKVFDLELWNAAAIQGSIDLSGVPTSINQIVQEISADVIAPNSEAAANFQSAGTAILQLVGSAAQWQAISGSLVLSYMDTESNSKGLPPLSKALGDLSTQLKQCSTPNIDLALATAKLYNDMIENPEDHVGASEAFAFNGAVLSNFHQTLSSLVKFLEAMKQL